MLTDIAVKKLLAGSPPEKRREVPDGKIRGLYFTLQPTGAASWSLRYRAHGKPTKLTLGSHPELGLSMARRRAQEALGAVAGGRDPAREKKAARDATKAAREAEEDKMELVVDSFVERYAKVKTRDWAETERILNREVVGRWKGKRLSQITRSQVHDMLDAIIDRGAPIRANRVFAQFRKMCKWATGRGIIAHSPCEGLSAPSPETRRDRVLTDAELKLVWGATESLGRPFGAVIKMLALTGARRDEVAGLRWNEIDLEARTWTLPAARSKNKRSNAIPLSDTAIDILRSLPRHEKVDFVFTTTGRTPVSGFSKVKENVDTWIVEKMRREAQARGVEPALMPDWVFHDIRRSVATNLQKLGVRLEVTEAVLGHTSGSRAGVVGIYQRHDWADEKRSALEAWARKLDQIVTGKTASNVVEMAQARA